MPGSFDDSWSAGPLGPFPFILLSQTDLYEDRMLIVAGSGQVVGAGMFHVPGALVQYAGASVTPAPIFRRTLFDRVGSRGMQ